MRMSRSQQRVILNQVLRYTRKTKLGGGMFSRLGRQFGAFGELLGMIVDIFSGGSQNPQKRDIEDAIKLLSEQGFRVEPGPVPPGVPPEPPVQGVQRPTRSQPPAVSTRTSTTRTRGGVPVVTPTAAPPDEAEAAEIWPEEGTVQQLPTRIRGAYDLMPADVTGMGPVIETPESSNVWGISFDFDEGILYVTYKADAAPIGWKDLVSSCSGKPYKCAIRPHVMGATYSYGGRGHKISAEQFSAFVGAASHGQWIWQNLRTCGSQWEHKVPYTLVTTSGAYVPRRSTRRGLRVRTVPNVGMGRRGGRLSTLPERIR